MKNLHLNLYTKHCVDQYLNTIKQFNLFKNSEKRNLLGTPETSLRGLRTLKVLRVERSGPVVFPSPDLGISIGRNLQKRRRHIIKIVPSNIKFEARISLK